MAPVLADALLARSPTAVLFLNRIQAAPEAWMFTITAIPAPRHRFAPETTVRMPLPPSVRQAFGRGDYIPEPIARRLSHADKGLIVELRYPDGSLADQDAWLEAMTSGVKPSGPVLAPGDGGSSGSAGVMQFGFKAYPLPDVGSVTLAVKWAAEGIERYEHMIDAALLHDAANRADRLPSV